VRRACLGHPLILGERHLGREPREDVAPFNRERRHQGIGQATVELSPGAMRNLAAPARTAPVPGGLHHACQRAAWQ
jgi:hypothetical protein